MLVAVGLLVAGIAASPAAAPGVRSKVCPHCSADTMAASARNAGLGEIYIWDPYDHGLMRKYRSYCGARGDVSEEQAQINDTVVGIPAESGICGAAPMTTEELPVEPRYAEAAPHLAVAYLASKQSPWITMGAPPTVRTVGAARPKGLRVDLDRKTWDAYAPQQPTAHDFFGDMVLRAQVQDYLRQEGASASGRFNTATVQWLRSQLQSWITAGPGFRITYEAVFHDGSSVMFDVAPGKPPAYVVGSGRDAKGKAIADPGFMKSG